MPNCNHHQIRGQQVVTSPTQTREKLLKQVWVLRNLENEDICYLQGKQCRKTRVLEDTTICTILGGVDQLHTDVE